MAINFYRFSIITTLTLSLFSFASCQSTPPTTQTTDNNLLSIQPIPQNLTAPPKGLTAPPKGFTIPPRGFSALMGKVTIPDKIAALTAPPKGFTQASNFSLKNLLLPPAFAQQSDFFIFKMLVNGKPMNEQIFQNIQRNTDNTITAQYYIPQTLQGQNIELSFATSQNNTLLQAMIPSLNGQNQVQNIDLESTSFALIQKTSPKILLTDIEVNSSTLQSIQNQLSTLLVENVDLDIQTDSSIKSTVEKTIENLVPQNLKVSSITVAPSPLTLKIGEQREIDVQVQFSNGFISKRTLWSSEDPLMVLGDSSNILTAFSEGQTSIKIRALSDSSKEVVLPVTITK